MKPPRIVYEKEFLIVSSFVYDMYMQIIVVINTLLCYFALGLTITTNQKP